MGPNDMETVNSLRLETNLVWINECIVPQSKELGEMLDLDFTQQPLPA